MAKNIYKMSVADLREALPNICPDKWKKMMEINNSITKGWWATILPSSTGTAACQKKEYRNPENRKEIIVYESDHQYDNIVPAEFDVNFDGLNGLLPICVHMYVKNSDLK